MMDNKSLISEIGVCTCVRCRKVMRKDSDDCDWQERLIISFRGGFGSVFGDNNLVEGVFCPECFHLLLGYWLRITFDDPFEFVDRHSTIKSIFLADKKLREQRRIVAAVLGKPEDQVSTIELECFFQANEPKQKDE